MKEKKMKILYITQAVDKDFYLLVPFYKWLNLLASRMEKIYALCLQEGRHEDLAANIEVKSLGKEKGLSRFAYVINFYKYTLPLIFGKKIDLIFVHMNELYVFMLWPFALVAGVPIAIWRAHGRLDWKAKLVTKLSNAIITSSETGHKVVTPKRHIIGQCVDLDHFPLKQNYSERVEKIIWVGRISPVKNLETLVKAAEILIKKQSLNLHFDIIGSAPDQSGSEYLVNLKSLIENLGLKDNFTFTGEIKHEFLPKTYQEADIFINTSDTGSLDKTVLEAMATGLEVINSNYGFNEILRDFPNCRFAQGNYEELAYKIEQGVLLNSQERNNLGSKLREIVVREHALNSFIEKLYQVLLAT